MLGRTGGRNTSGVLQSVITDMVSVQAASAEQYRNPW